MLIEPENEEDSGIIVERPQPRTSACKKIFQTLDDFIGVQYLTNVISSKR